MVKKNGCLWRVQQLCNKVRGSPSKACMGILNKQSRLFGLNEADSEMGFSQGLRLQLTFQCNSQVVSSLSHWSCSHVHCHVTSYWCVTLSIHEFELGYPLHSFSRENPSKSEKFYGTWNGMNGMVVVAGPCTHTLHKVQGWFNLG